MVLPPPLWLPAFLHSVAMSPHGLLSDCRTQQDERRVGVWPVLKRIYAENGIR